jgi:hypothetical protein
MGFTMAGWAPSFVAVCALSVIAVTVSVRGLRSHVSHTHVLHRPRDQAVQQPTARRVRSLGGVLLYESAGKMDGWREPNKAQRDALYAAIKAKGIEKVAQISTTTLLFDRKAGLSFDQREQPESAALSVCSGCLAGAGHASFSRFAVQVPTAAFAR